MFVCPTHVMPKCLAVDSPTLGGFKPRASAGSFQPPGLVRGYGGIPSRGSHSVVRLHVHLVWCTKYRKQVLVKDVARPKVHPIVVLDEPAIARTKAQTGVQY